MWLRMVAKQPVLCLDSLHQATGKSWGEWHGVLAMDLQQKCGVLSLTDFLMQRYNLSVATAKFIAMEYVLGIRQSVN